MVRIVRDKLKISRDELIQQMAARGVGTSVHFIPLHYQPYWRDKYSLTSKDFPVSSFVYENSVSLPIYPKMSDADVQRQIYFDSPWAISEVDAGDMANVMHDRVVEEISGKIRDGILEIKQEGSDG